MNVNEYYGFKKNPFGKYVEVDEVYRSNDYIQIYNRIQNVLECEGIGIITGKSGSGKTTAVKSFIKNQKERCKFIFIQGSQMSVFDFYHSICNALNVKISDCHKIRIIEEIQRELVELKKNGIRIMVILDDAHELPSSILQELRIFYDYGLEEDASIALLIVGHTSFRRTLKKEKYETLHNRIIANYDCNGLDYNEIKEYIQKRIKDAGIREELLDERNYININSYSERNPRKINTLMNTLLLIGCVEETKRFDTQMIKRAKEEMEI